VKRNCLLLSIHDNNLPSTGAMRSPTRALEPAASPSSRRAFTFSCPSHLILGSFMLVGVAPEPGNEHEDFVGHMPRYRDFGHLERDVTSHPAYVWLNRLHCSASERSEVTYDRLRSAIIDVKQFLVTSFRRGHRHGPSSRVMAHHRR
jgi:hypothetical protein